MLPTPPGKHCRLNLLRSKRCSRHSGLVERAARLRPRPSAVIGDKIG